MASVSEVRSLLVDTTMPQEVIDESLDRASTVWLMSASAELLARDLVLCHPPIGPQEVRAVAHPLGEGCLRLTVVAHDRPGLLADTAAVLAAGGLSVSGASAMTWTGSGLALHALTVSGARMTDDRWTRLGACLQGLGTAAQPAVAFRPIGRATVKASPSGMGRCVVTVAAPDQVGLLWAICQWFAEQGVSIEAAQVGADDGAVNDHFLVVGQPDPSALAAHLTAAGAALPSLATAMAGAAGALLGVGTGIFRRVARVLR